MIGMPLGMMPLIILPLTFRVPGCSGSSRKP